MHPAKSGHYFIVSIPKKKSNLVVLISPFTAWVKKPFWVILLFILINFAFVWCYLSKETLLCEVINMKIKTKNLSWTADAELSQGRLREALPWQALSWLCVLWRGKSVFPVLPLLPPQEQWRRALPGASSSAQLLNQPNSFELEEENGSHHRIFSLKRSSPFSNSDWNFLQYSGLEQVLAIQCNKQWKSWQCTFCFRHILYLTLWRDKICKENTSDFHALEQTHFKTLCPVFSTLSLTSPSVRKWNSGIPDFQMCSWSLWDINQILQDTRMPQNIWDPRPNRPSRSQDKGQESKP